MDNLVLGTGSTNTAMLRPFNLLSQWGIQHTNTLSQNWAIRQALLSKWKHRRHRQNQSPIAPTQYSDPNHPLAVEILQLASSVDRVHHHCYTCHQGEHINIIRDPPLTIKLVVNQQDDFLWNPGPGDAVALRFWTGPEGRGSMFWVAGCCYWCWIWQRRESGRRCSTMRASTRNLPLQFHLTHSRHSRPKPWFWSSAGLLWNRNDFHNFNHFINCCTSDGNTIAILMTNLRK